MDLIINDNSNIGNDIDDGDCGGVSSADSGNVVLE